MRTLNLFPSLASLSRTVAWPALPVAALLCLQAKTAGAQNSQGQVPDNQLSPAVLGELKRLENQFELALAQDCPAEKCFSRGCTYGAHVVADKPRQGGLPGLGDDRGPGSGTPQEYLTQARCEVASESSIPAKDVQVLVRRLEQKLSKGHLVVTVESKPLPPLPSSLKQTPAPATPVPAATLAPTATPATATPTPAPTPAPDAPWDGRTMGRELWLALLPYLPWMLALVLASLLGMLLLWSWRRLGLESAEEKALMASLAAQPPEATPSGEEKKSDREAILNDEMVEKAFVAEQSMTWTNRVEKDPHVLDKVLTTWLRDGEFALLAKAVFEFEETVKPDFPVEGDLARRKLEFAEFLKRTSPSDLPADVDFYRLLNQHALVASVLAQSDAEICARLRDEFGPGGTAELVARLPSRLGAILLTLVSADERREVAQLLSAETGVAIIRELLVTNRASREEIGLVLSAVRATCAGMPLPNLAAASSKDMGQEVDAAGVLSALLPLQDKGVRQQLVAEALKAHAGIAPLWLQKVFFAEMLLAIPKEQRTEILLGVDLAALAAWLPSLAPAQREKLRSEMPPSLANALASAQLLEGKAHQANAALANDLAKAYASGQLQWSELVAKA